MVLPSSLTMQPFEATAVSRYSSDSAKRVRRSWIPRPLAGPTRTPKARRSRNAASAAKFGYNESYLSTLFLSKTKRNFRDYVTDARMSRACDLLATTSLTMAQVAEAVGYASSDHFQRMFKRKMGVTPGTYRRESGTS